MGIPVPQNRNRDNSSSRKLFTLFGYLLYKLSAAFGAGLFNLVLRHRLCVFAFGVAGQARNLPKRPDFTTIFLPHLSHTTSVSTTGTFTFRPSSEVSALLYNFFKIAVKVSYSINPAAVARAYFVKLLFKTGGKFNIYYFIEILNHKVGNHYTEIGGLKRLFLALDIVAPQNVGNYGSIGGRSAYSVFGQAPL